MPRPTVEQLYGPHLRGGGTTIIDGAYEAFAGRTTLNSGSTSVVVSTSLVQSNSVLLMGVQTGSMGTQSAGAITVNSIVDGVSFAFARNNNVAAQWNDVVMWQLWRT